MRTTARRDGDSYVLHGAKAWTTHGGEADFYKVMARTSDDRNGITCFLVPADSDGLTADPPEKKMGLTGSTTTQVLLDGVRVPESARIGDEGRGMPIALSALDGGRLGIAACATGLAQAALAAAVEWAGERQQFGRRIGEFQGLQFLLADMGIRVEAARQITYAAAGRSERGDKDLTFFGAASKTFASDTAMQVTTDAVQVLGGYGFTRDYPVERMMRDAKITQIYEGTNQIQRMVMARQLLK